MLKLAVDSFEPRLPPVDVFELLLVAAGGRAALGSDSTSEPDSQHLEDAHDGDRVLHCVFTELPEPEWLPLSFDSLSLTTSPQIFDRLLDLAKPFEDFDPGVCRAERWRMWSRNCS